MGDRCWVQITVRAKDVREWLKLGYDFEFDEDAAKFEVIEPDQLVTADPVELKDSERNYGVSYRTPEDIGNDLVLGCPMIGFSDAGGTYGDEMFAWDGKTFRTVQTNKYGVPVVRVSRLTRKIVEDDFAEVSEFLDFFAEVEKLVGVVDSYLAEA